MAGKSIVRTFALLTALVIVPITALAAIEAAGNGEQAAPSDGLSLAHPTTVYMYDAVSDAPDKVWLVDYEFAPFDAAADTSRLLDRLVQSGATIWELPPIIPDPAPLAIFGLGLLALGFLRLFKPVH